MLDGDPSISHYQYHDIFRDSTLKESRDLQLQLYSDWYSARFVIHRSWYSCSEDGILCFSTYLPSCILITYILDLI